MRRVLILAVIATGSLCAQWEGIARVQEFLSLTEAQISTMNENNRKFDEWVWEKQARINDVQMEIAQQTSRSPLEPMALGIRYAEIETICREARERGVELQKTNAAVLTDAQRVRLKVLEDALKLVPVIAEAQSLRVLGGDLVSNGVFLLGGDRFNRTDGTRLGYVPYLSGCSVPAARWFDTTNFQSATVRK